tara:strand:- start:194 stop:430 length:237 start_codon:yes stop_codon:yes gene_type:complete
MTEIVSDSDIQFIAELLENGYEYNSEHRCYERVWTTNNGKESIVELYLKESNQWVQQMIGYGGRVFYEETVTKDKLSQ